MKINIVLGSCAAISMLAACTQEITPARTTATPAAEPASMEYSEKQEARKYSNAQDLVLSEEMALEHHQYSDSIANHAGRTGMVAPATQPLSSVVDFYTFPHRQPPVSGDQFSGIESNPVKLVKEQPLSTFSIDVDTGAYAVVRRFLNDGQLPPRAAVRTEELVNYFDYQYPVPSDSQTPFSVSTEIAPAPWDSKRHLVQIGLQGYLPDHERPPANLVFLVDVSGSMSAADKLPLLKNAFRLLTSQLREQDRVSIVVYAGASGVVLEPTPGSQRATIMTALEQLDAGGSTHGSAGIQLAYAMARQAFIDNGINRVILATDGDFNVGTVNHDQLVELIEQKRSQGISLTTLGFGAGNYNDHLMEQLADHGDGNYAYIDSLGEAKKVLVDQLDATLETIARDVKIQVEWNPQHVSEYRLIGYENRLLRREDFNNDKVDAGDIGAGHRVTALYEVTLATSQSTRIDPLRYQEPAIRQGLAHSDELAHIKLRYKRPAGIKSRLIQHALLVDEIKPTLHLASENLKLATAVAAWGELLRGSTHLNSFSFDDVLTLARQARGSDSSGYRGEFLKLVELSGLLNG